MAIGVVVPGVVVVFVVVLLMARHAGIFAARRIEGEPRHGGNLLDRAKEDGPSVRAVRCRQSDCVLLVPAPRFRTAVEQAVIGSPFSVVWPNSREFLARSQNETAD
jgi:hypothetical protein